MDVINVRKRYVMSHFILYLVSNQIRTTSINLRRRTRVSLSISDILQVLKRNRNFKQPQRLVNFKNKLELKVYPTMAIQHAFRFAVKFAKQLNVGLMQCSQNEIKPFEPLSTSPAYFISFAKSNSVCNHFKIFAQHSFICQLRFESKFVIYEFSTLSANLQL